MWASRPLLVSLTQATARRGLGRALAVVCLVVTSAASVYLYGVTEDLEMRFGLGLTTPQTIAGISIIVAVLVLCWMEWGVVIAGLGVVALSYFFFGDLIPGPLRAATHPSFSYAMTFLISSGGTGLYGQITPISANIIFLFMLFGGLLASTGVTRLFLELGNWLGDVFKGGAAVTCVVSSSLFGTVTGATVANVAITGTFTIPTMKRQGFRAQDAGAIEAVASCGGQVLPPVMGAGAFIMAAYLGIAYIEIATRALLPAIMFYGSVLIAILFLVRKAGGITESLPVDYGAIRAEVLPFLVPLATLIYFLLLGYSATGAAFNAIASVFVVTLLRPSTWRSRAGFVNTFRGIAGGLVLGARQGAGLAIVTAVISLVAQSLITTALGPKFASSLGAMVGDSTFVALLLVMFASIILGCGLPTVAAYTMVAIMMVPALRNIGIDPFAAHMFVYYFAVYAAVTPPVATAALVASRIAETNFWGTAWASMRLMSGPLIIPFLFIYHPQVLEFPPDPVTMALPLLGWLTATIALLVVNVRYLIVVRPGHIADRTYLRHG
jgi:TRAP transporter 4TM/12TM fusion protein